MIKIKQKELLFSLTKKDFKVEPFKGSGAGGQHRNKTMSCCKITHLESGAIGIGTEHREFPRNKKLAFERLINSDKFQNWHKIEVARHLGKHIDIEKQVEEWMKPKNIKVEVQEEGKWIKEEVVERRLNSEN